MLGDNLAAPLMLRPDREPGRAILKQPSQSTRLGKQDCSTVLWLAHSLIQGKLPSTGNETLAHASRNSCRGRKWEMNDIRNFCTFIYTRNPICTALHGRHYLIFPYRRKASMYFSCQNLGDRIEATIAACVSRKPRRKSACIHGLQVNLLIIKS